MFPGSDRLYFIVTNYGETKESDSVDEAFSAIQEAMILDGYENAPCPAIATLDSNWDPGDHETCPILMYDELYQKAAVDDDSRKLFRRRDYS